MTQHWTAGPLSVARVAAILAEAATRRPEAYVRTYGKHLGMFQATDEGPTAFVGWVDLLTGEVVWLTEPDRGCRNA
jgi:hypothetical protein